MLRSGGQIVLIVLNSKVYLNNFDGCLTKLIVSFMIFKCHNWWIINQRFILTHIKYVHARKAQFAPLPL